MSNVTAVSARRKSGTSLVTDDSALRAAYKKEDAWGLHSAIDLYECHPSLIRNADEVKRFVYELCERIGMKRFGECVVVDFGEDPRVSGFSMTQLIETSLISGHFANQSNAVYLDVFSCKYYNPYIVAEFAKQFFRSKRYNLNHTLRK